MLALSAFLAALPVPAVLAQQPSEPTLLSADRVSSAQSFQMTTLQTSEPRVFAAITDRALGIAMKRAVLPVLFGEDSRYMASPSSSGIRRVADAAAHTVVTRRNGGRLRFNAPEIGGAGITAGLSNLYRPAADRSMTATLSRWGAQLLFDTLSDELKEFAPDIRRALRRR